MRQRGFCNGAGDVFAMDVDTGVIHWSYRGNPDQRGGSQ